MHSHAHLLHLLVDRQAGVDDDGHGEGEAQGEQVDGERQIFLFL